MLIYFHFKLLLMKINLLLVLFFLQTTKLLAQQDSIQVMKQEEYCLLRISGILFSAKVTIDVDYGDKRHWGDNRLRDETTGKLIKFNSPVDALNFLGEQGWGLVNAFPDISNGSSSTLYVFKRTKRSDEAMLSVKQNKNPG